MKIGDPGKKREPTQRDAIIVRTSIIGIAANVFLASFKAGVGLLSHSIAIVLDAVNNLSDAASSVITIAGTKLAAKEPDRKHPFGHGRVEYLTAMVIAVIILYAGITSFTESVRKIIHPETPDYAPVSLLIIAAAVVVKIVLGRYVKGVGEKVNSDSLIASGEDATLDSVISASTLVAAVIYLVFHVSLEAWLGAAISVIIIKSGVDMLRGTISSILGERADAELAQAIRATVCSFPGVQGAYDLVLHNYGPDSYNGSIHIEVPDTVTADELDELTRQITVKVLHEHHVLLTAISVYSVNTKDQEAIVMREKMRQAASEIPDILQMHGFYMNRKDKKIRLDLVVGFEAKDRTATYCEAVKRLQALCPEYTLEVGMDTDYTL